MIQDRDFPNPGNVIDTFLRISEMVDSGSPDGYIDFIKAASLAIHEIIQTKTSREEFARRYGENMLKQLLGPKKIKNCNGS